MGTVVDGVQITGASGERDDEVLTPEALEFLADLHRTFDARRRELLQARDDRYSKLAAGEMLDFLPETQRSATATGRWRRPRPACSTAASRSPVRPTAR